MYKDLAKMEKKIINFAAQLATLIFYKQTIFLEKKISKYLELKSTNFKIV